MPEALKEMFNAAYFTGLATQLTAVYPKFQRVGFLADVQRGNESRELNARLRHASVTVRRHLPRDYRAAVGILRELAPRMPSGYTALLYPDFVGQFGLEDPAFSLDALKYFTSFGSSEFAVREFLRRDVPGTLKVMRQWAEHDSEHVRRLSSEGSRPRLPWSFRLDAVLKDPRLTTPILERLKGDPALYVRKSVANHLNDFSKDHPGYMVDLVRSWDRRHPDTCWIAKHACRTLIKAGHPEALALFGFNTGAKVRVDHLTVARRHVTLGETLAFSFTLTSEATRSQQVVVDYAIHYRKAEARTSRKVFKLTELELGAGAAVNLAKRQRFVDFSTRKHYPGRHTIEVLVNGKTMATTTFDLKR